MNNWPKPSDFADVLQCPRIAFRENDLKQATVRTNAQGIPCGPAGTFAVVYQITLPTGQKQAVRVFTSQRKGIKDRYQAISDHLAANPNLKCTVGFRFVEKGIRATDGKWYPIVRMDWVEGTILSEWLREKCLANNKAALVAMADSWLKLVQELRTAQIAHGDLQHANVMVVPSGELKLVDYDSMCVPKLVGEPTIEGGVIPYQHPGRDSSTTLSLDLDNFSTIVIYAAIKALAFNPGLWKTYIDNLKYEKLLFQVDDLAEPHRSQLMAALLASSDSQLVNVIKKMLELYKAPIANARPVLDYLFSWKDVQQALASGRYDEALELVESNQQPVPANLVAPIAEAKTKVQALQKLEQAIASGDEQAISTAYARPQLFQGYARASALLPVAQLAAQVLASEQAIQAAINKKDYRQAVVLVDQHLQKFPGRNSLKKWPSVIGPIRRANQLCDTIKNLLKVDLPDGDLLESSDRELSSLGGHVELGPQAALIKRRIGEAKAWQRFTASCQLDVQASAVPSLNQDKLIVAAWQKERSILENWNVMQRVQAYVGAADKRLNEMKLLDTQLGKFRQTRSGTLAAEVLRLFNGLPTGYLPVDYTKDVESFIEATAAIDAFRNVMKQSNLTEAQIAKAGERLKQTNSYSLLSKSEIDRIEQAIRRAPLVEKVLGISLKDSSHATDSLLLQAWHHDLTSCPELTQHRQAFEAAQQRKRIMDAMRTNSDSVKFGELYSQCMGKLFDHYLFPPDVQQLIDEFKAGAGGVLELVEYFNQGDLQRFRQCLDAVRVRQYSAVLLPMLNNDPTRFMAFAKKALTECEPAEIGLKPHRIFTKIAPLPDGRLKAFWVFPQQKMYNECLFALVSGEVPEDPRTCGPDKVQNCATIRIEGHVSSGSSREFRAPPRGRWQVLVWAVINLAPLGELISRPLSLGFVPLPAKPKK